MQQPLECSQMQACSREQAVRLNMSLLPKELPSHAEIMTNGQALNLRAIVVETMSQASYAGRESHFRKIIRLCSLVVEDGPAPAPTHSLQGQMQ